MTRPDPLPMTPDEKRVWALIEGREVGLKGDLFGPIKNRRLAQATGFDGRETRDIIRCLRRNHRKLIGSSTKAPAGYYECKTTGQVDDFCGGLWGRAMDMLYTIKVMKQTSAEELGRLVQEALFKEEEREEAA